VTAKELIKKIEALHEGLEAIPAEVAGFSGVARIMDLEVYYTEEEPPEGWRAGDQLVVVRLKAVEDGLKVAEE